MCLLTVLIAVWVRWLGGDSTLLCGLSAAEEEREREEDGGNQTGRCVRNMAAFSRYLTARNSSIAGSLLFVLVLLKHRKRTRSANRSVARARHVGPHKAASQQFVTTHANRSEPAHLTGDCDLLPGGSQSQPVSALAARPPFCAVLR